MNLLNILFFCINVFTSLESEHPEGRGASWNQDFFSFSITDINGRQTSLESYRGKVLLVVNVASECGFTDSHYKSLVILQETLGQTEQFQVLAFPCNQFGGQEPKDNADILKFAQDTYNINFPIFGKVNVINSDIPDMWKYLQESSGLVPTWNFYKYLINPQGNVINAWGPWQNIDDILSVIKTEVDKAILDGRDTIPRPVFLQPIVSEDSTDDEQEDQQKISTSQNRPRPILASHKLPSKPSKELHDDL